MRGNACFSLCLMAVFFAQTPNSTFSQESPDPFGSETYPSYLVFLEAGGHALISINYEKYFLAHMGIRIGYGWCGIPILLNYYVGRRRMLELGAGAVYSPYGPLKPYTGAENMWVFGLTIGHKFQPNEGGLTLRYSFTPMFDPSSKRFVPMVGLSFGLACQ